MVTDARASFCPCLISTTFQHLMIQHLDGPKFHFTTFQHQVTVLRPSVNQRSLVNTASPHRQFDNQRYPYMSSEPPMTSGAGYLSR